MTKLIFCLKQNIINVFFVYLVILMILHRHQTTSHNGIVSYGKVSLLISNNNNNNKICYTRFRVNVKIGHKVKPGVENPAHIRIICAEKLWQMLDLTEK